MICMKINAGYLINKLIRFIHRPALRDCEIDSTSKIGSASNCIRVKMGKYSYAGYYNSMCDVNIGSFCSIASYCSIGGGNHSIYSVSTSPVFFKGRNILRKNFSDLEYETSERVIIGNDVWIGEGVFIKSGVSIGHGAVIGAHSVVTNNVEPYSIVAGVPAKEIRKRFDANTINKLLEINWWELSEDELYKLGNSFINPNELIYNLKNKGQ